MKNIPCPICAGSGKLEKPKHAPNDLGAKRVMAQALRESGYSLRQIARLCGWKSVRSAVVAIQKPEKRKP